MRQFTMRASAAIPAAGQSAVASIVCNSSALWDASNGSFRDQDASVVGICPRLRLTDAEADADATELNDIAEAYGDVTVEIAVEGSPVYGPVALSMLASPGPYVYGGGGPTTNPVAVANQPIALFPAPRVHIPANAELEVTFRRESGSTFSLSATLEATLVCERE